MATYTATRAAPTFPVYQGLGGGDLSVAYGSFDLASNLAAATIIEFCRVPAGAVIIDGFVRMEDIDSNASEEFDFDVGYAANGAVAADPDAFGDFGVHTGDALVGYLPEGGTCLPFHGVLKDGFLTLTRETTIIGTINVDAATFAAGTISVAVYYVNP